MLRRHRHPRARFAPRSCSGSLSLAGRRCVRFRSHRSGRLRHRAARSCLRRRAPLRLRRPSPAVRQVSADARAARLVAGVSGGNDGRDDGAQTRYACADPSDAVGRVASRPGFPLQSPLRSDLRCNPSRLRSLTLTSRSAWPAARQARRRCRNDVIAPRLDRTTRRTAAVSSRALRAALVSDLASLALAGYAGCGHRLGSSRRHTPCAAGDGFAGHRAPHYAVQSCPCECGHFRPSLRQRAAHDCLRLRPHRRPLTRRGGFPPPGSPAPISRSPVRRDSGFRPAGAGFGSTPHASMMQRAHARVEPAVSRSFGASRCLPAPASCWTESLLWRTALNPLESLDFPQGGFSGEPRFPPRTSPENRRFRAALLWRTAPHAPASPNSQLRSPIPPAPEGGRPPTRDRPGSRPATDPEGP